MMRQGVLIKCKRVHNGKKKKGEMRMVYAMPNTEGSKVTFKDKYENFINGEWKAPVKGQYFENVSPVTGKKFTEIAR